MPPPIDANDYFNTQPQTYQQQLQAFEDETSYNNNSQGNNSRVIREIIV